MTSSLPVLITGGGQRIGLYCAERLLDDGQPVIISYRRERESVARLRQRGALAIQADLASESGILTFIDQLKALTHGLRAIVHNASAWLPDAPNPAAAFTQMVGVHMLAPYLINLHCADLLRHGGAADIVHLSDDVTRKGSSRHIAYAASKAGLDSLTQSFAAHFAPDIRVNGIAPAMIQFNEGDDADYRARALAKSPLGFEPGPAVVYQALRYLLDTSYVTGTTLQLNGGRHLR